MRLVSALAALAAVRTCLAGAPLRKNHDTHEYYAVHLHPSGDPNQVAIALGLDYEGPLGELADHHTFSSPRARRHDADDVLEDLRLRRRKRDLNGLGPLEHIRWHQKQKLKPRMVKRDVPPPLLGRQNPAVSDPSAHTSEVNAEAVAERTAIEEDLMIKDPIFNEQWHLFNTVQLGHDLNVTGLWEKNITGHGATAVMVDDGIDMYSEDLMDNYFAEGSYDFNDHTDEPRPRLTDDKHGTRCAGEIAAVRNGVCGVGVAYNARIGGIRILSKEIEDDDEAVAMNYKFQDNQIYSCSWGPPDDGRSMDAPDILIQKALVNGVQNGRQGKGSLFVFAAGNGHSSGDNCNFDGYTNSIYTITIGGIDRRGQHPYYSEHCSAQLVVTYSSGAGDAIHTTDIGVNQCFANHGGTSAAAPLGAGVFALALSVRPELTWRDIQSLCVLTAVPINVDDEWQKTTIGKMYSHVFGYGKIDAYAFVEKAQEVELLKPQAWFKGPWMHVVHPIPQGVEGLLSSFEVTEEHLKGANLERLEQVTVTMNVNHTRRGDLSVELRSPSNVVSHLSVSRRLDDADQGYEDWTFMSVAHWGENGLGKWSVVVKDTNINEHNGTFIDWRLTLWGECIDAANQELLPMPTEHDDDHDDRISATPSKVSIDPGESATAPLPAVPSDHPDRPVKPKPGKPASTTAQATAASTTEEAAVETSDVSSLPDVPEETESKDDHFLPHIFPTFGVSKRTQIWIYGALAIIVIFCAGLGAYFVIVRRRRKRSQRDEYEFEMLEDEEHLNGASGGRRPKRRAGELYDAFAGESDEEQLLSDEEDEEEDDQHEVKEAYRDKVPDRGSRGPGPDADDSGDIREKQ